MICMDDSKSPIQTDIKHLVSLGNDTSMRENDSDIEESEESDTVHDQDADFFGI